MSSKSKTGNVSGRGRRNKNGGNQPQSKLLDSKFQPPKNQSKLSDSKLQQKSPVTALENLNVEPLQRSKLLDNKNQQSLVLARTA